MQNFLKKPSVLHLRLRRDGAIGWGRGLDGRSGQRSLSLLSGSTAASEGDLGGKTPYEEVAFEISMCGSWRRWKYWGEGG